MSKTECPVCGADIFIQAGAVEGELIECGDCGVELEIISIDPFSVEEAPQTEEDWGE